MGEGKVSNNVIGVLACAYYIMSDILSHIVPGGIAGRILMAVVLAIFFVVCYRNQGVLNIKITYYHVNIFLFAAFCAVSSLWAQKGGVALSKGVQIFKILITMSVLYLAYQDMEDMEGLLRVIMYGCYGVAIYGLFFYGWEYLQKVLAIASRVSNEHINANRLGMCAAYAMVINLHFILYEGLSPRDLLMLPSLPILISSGSRKAIVLLVAGVFGVTILKNWNNRKFFNSVFKVMLVVLACSVLFYFVFRLPVFEGIRRRMLDLFEGLFSSEAVTGGSAWLRFEYNKLGVRLFWEHPLTGIGIANANIYTLWLYGKDHYLHNNYIELLACGGLIGFCIYYSVYVIILYRMAKYRKDRDRTFDVCLVLLVVKLVMDYGLVNYYAISTYVFLLLFWLETVKVREKSIESENIKKSGEIEESGALKTAYF